MSEDEDDGPNVGDRVKVIEGLYKGKTGEMTKLELSMEEDIVEVVFDDAFITTMPWIYVEKI